MIIIIKGDLYDEDQILQWLMTQKDPSGEMIEKIEGEDLLNLIRESESLAIYFCELFLDNSVFQNNIKFSYVSSDVNIMTRNLNLLIFISGPINP